MSNDDTHNDDSTVKLPDNENKYDTKPGITAVLERINALDERLGQRMGDLQLSVDSFRSEVLKALRQVERQVEHLWRDYETPCRSAGFRRSSC